MSGSRTRTSLQQPNPKLSAAPNSNPSAAADVESATGSRLRICPNLSVAADSGCACSSRTWINLQQLNPNLWPHPNLSAAGDSASDCGSRIRICLRQPIRIQLLRTVSDSAAADRFGLGCCRQNRNWLPLTDSDSAAADRLGCGCRGQIRNRLLQTGSDTTAADRFGFGQIRVRLPQIRIRLRQTEWESAATDSFGSGCR